MRHAALALGFALLFLTSPTIAQTGDTQLYESQAERDMQDLENALKISRKAIPIYRKLLQFQRQNLTSVPARNGQYYDFSQGPQGLRQFSREIDARVRGASQGSEQDLLWVEQFLLPTAERALDSGVIRDLVELGEYADQLP